LLLVFLSFLTAHQGG